MSVPTSRGILRASSYSSTSKSSDDDDSISRSSQNEPPREPTTRRLPAMPRKPERRNVGKVERRGGRRGDLVSAGRSISFSEKVEEQPVTKIPRYRSNEFFYDEEEIARFRHDAFIESAGLDPEEFPYEDDASD